MRKWVIWDVATGMIDSLMSGPEMDTSDMNDHAPEGKAFLELDPAMLSDPSRLTHYVSTTGIPSTPTLIEKTEMTLTTDPDPATITADGSDTVTINGYPTSGTIVVVNGEYHAVTDSALDFAVDLAGTYVLTFKHALWLDTEVSVVAESPA